MSHLLEAFPVRFFWRSNGLSGSHLIRLIAYLRVEAESLDQTGAIEGGREFERIFALIAKSRRGGSPSPRVKRSGPATQLYPVPYDEAASFRILGLAPSGNQVERYERGLHQCFNDDGTIRARLPHADHNRISMALMVIFGETRILLGGDVEREGWQDVIAEMGATTLASQGVKVSHHGSPTGYCDGLWSHISARSSPLAIVTAYAAQRLPRKVALEHIRPHTREILTTCLTAVNDDQLPGWTDPRSARLRLALKQKMGRVVQEMPHQCGRCTLVFDDRGQCIDAQTTPPAGRLSSGFGP
jgi:hypothetical protein